MKVKEIEVSAGRTFNHPYESYSNLKPSVTMKATLDDDDDPVKCTQQLQAKAEELVEDHKRIMLKQQEVHRLESQIKSAQSELDRLRDGTKALASEQLFGDDEADPEDNPH